EDKRPQKTPVAEPLAKPARRPRAVPVEGDPSSATTPQAQPVSLRLGVDFGTSTIQVAVGLSNQTPRLLQLAPATEYMPSSLAMGPRSASPAPKYRARSRAECAPCDDDRGAGRRVVRNHALRFGD